MIQAAAGQGEEPAHNPYDQQGSLILQEVQPPVQAHGAAQPDIERLGFDHRLLAMLPHLEAHAAVQDQGAAGDQRQLHTAGSTPRQLQRKHVQAPAPADRAPPAP